MSLEMEWLEWQWFVTVASVVTTANARFHNSFVSNPSVMTDDVHLGTHRSKPDNLPILDMIDKAK